MVKMYGSNLAEKAHQRLPFDAESVRVIGNALKSVIKSDDSITLDKSIMEDYDLP